MSDQPPSALVAEPVAIEILPSLSAEADALVAAYKNGHADAIEQMRMQLLLAAPLPASPVQPVVAAEWVMVPREPTEAMEEAGEAAFFASPNRSRSYWAEICGDAYRAMLAVAPKMAAIPVGYICERIALTRLRDDIDSGLALHPHKRKVVRDWIDSAIASCEEAGRAAAKVEAPVARAEGEALKFDIALFVEPLSRARIEGVELIATFPSKLRAIAAREFCHSMTADLATPKAEPPASGLRAEMDAGGEVSGLPVGVEPYPGCTSFNCCKKWVRGIDE